MVEIRFPESGLSSEYGNIIFGSVVGYALVTVSIGGNVFLNEKYIPDPEGIITIMDIGIVAMSYFDDNDFSADNGIDGSAVVLQVSVTEKDSVVPVVKTVTIYPCVVDFSGSVNAETLVTLPLSRAINKTTGYGRREWLSFYGGCTVTLYCVYRGDTADVSETVEFSVLADPLKFYRLNVSPAVIATKIGCSESDLIYYNLYSSADSIIRFTMSERNYPKVKTFVFRNCFGAQECFTCISDQKSERKWTREFGSYNRKQVSTTKDLVNKFTVYTGPILNDDQEVLEDMLNSDHVCLLDEHGFQPIVILDESFVVTDRSDEVNEANFSYRFAQENQQKTTYKAFTKPRVFSDQFDNSFN